LYKFWLMALAAAFYSVCGVAQTIPEPEQHSGTAIELAGAWVRALPPTQTNTAAYLTISNRGASAITIVGGSAELADSVEFHATREIDGYMRMEQLHELSVAAGQSAELAPGGTHLMLLGLARMPASGETVRLCLKMATGAEVCTAAEVRKNASGAHKHDHH